VTIKPSSPFTLPREAGLGLKPDFYDQALAYSGGDIWYEIHPENYMVEGGPRLNWLEAFCDKFAVSFHGVGASLGGLDPFEPNHLASLKSLIDRFNPAQVSEHATWSSFEGQYFADLLPLPRTKAVQDHMVERIDAFQNALGRRILIENPTNYMAAHFELDEPEFLVDIAKRAGCGLLVDVNNIYISSVNVGVNAQHYLDAIPAELVGEIHIAGFDPDATHGQKLLIDTHSAPVSDPVWELLDYALARFGPKPVLLERDGNIPAFEVLMAEHKRAGQALGNVMDKRTKRKIAAATSAVF
jgi:uncharacterized protein (UPF0276 family)